MELAALLCTCTSVRPPKIAVPPALAARVNRFWEDGWGSLAELVVLTHRADRLDDTEIDVFLERLTRPISFDELPALETEPADERDVIHARLRRLAGDRRLRTRYARLLGDLWAIAADAWAGGGRTRATEVAASWAARLAAGSDALSLLPEGEHIALREPYPEAVRQAQRTGELRLTPVVAGYGHIVALPGMLSVAFYADAEPAEVARRRAATEIVGRLRPLTDATRVTILAQLAHAPAGVGELAAALHIAQPTASVHLRQLREAGLVEGRRDGARTVYAVRGAELEALLADVSDRVTRTIAAG